MKKFFEINMPYETDPKKLFQQLSTKKLPTFYISYII